MEWTYSENGFDARFCVFIPKARFFPQKNDSDSFSSIENVFKVHDEIDNKYIKKEIERRLKFGSRVDSHELRFVGSISGREVSDDLMKFIRNAIPKLKTIVESKYIDLSTLDEETEIEDDAQPLTRCSLRQKQTKTSNRLEIVDVIDLTSQSSENLKHSDDVVSSNHLDSEDMDNQEATDVFYELCGSDGDSIFSDVDNDSEQIEMRRERFKLEPFDKVLLEQFMKDVSLEYSGDNYEINNSSTRKRKSEDFIDFSHGSGKLMKPSHSKATSQLRSKICSPHVMESEKREKRNVINKTPAKPLEGFKVNKKTRPDTPFANESKYIDKYLNSIPKSRTEKPRMNSRMITNRTNDSVIKAKRVEELPSEFGIPQKPAPFKIPKINIGSTTMPPPPRREYGIITEKDKKALAKIDQNIMIINENFKKEEINPQATELLDCDETVSWYHEDKNLEKNAHSTLNATGNSSQNKPIENGNEDDVIFVPDANDTTCQEDSNNNDTTKSKKRVLYNEEIIANTSQGNRFFKNRGNRSKTPHQTSLGPDFKQPDGDPSRSRSTKRQRICDVDRQII